jgi:hypothetical protein
MRGAIGSLNASVAGSILLFAAVAQRDPAGLGDKPARPTGADAWPVRDEPASPNRSAETKPTKRSRGQSVVAPDPVDASAGTEPASDDEPSPPARGRRTAKPGVDPAAEPAAKTPDAASSKPRAKDRGAATKATRPATAAEPSLAATPAKATRSRKSRATEAAGIAVVKPVRRRSAAPKTSTKASTDAAERVPEADDLLPGGPTPD